MSVVSTAAAEFFKACGREYEFPTGNGIAIYSVEEEKLIAECEMQKEDVAGYAADLAKSVDWSDAYSLAILGLRMAVLAARKNESRSFRIAIALVVAGGQKIDYRDSLRAFAILERCAESVGIELLEAMSELRDRDQLGRLEGIFEDYFEREKKMRQIDVMGIRQVGEGAELQFQSSGLS
jgi:hypothetical protein